MPTSSDAAASGRRSILTASSSHADLLEEESESAPVYCTFGWTLDGPYEDVPDLGALATICASYVSERNADVPKAPISLAPFKAAVDLIARTVRALRLDMGHAMLVGPPGTGKRTVAKLAAYLAGFELLELELKGSPSAAGGAGSGGAGGGGQEATVGSLGLSGSAAGGNNGDRYWRVELKQVRST